MCAWPLALLETLQDIIALWNKALLSNMGQACQFEDHCWKWDVNCEIHIYIYIYVYVYIYIS